MQFLGSLLREAYTACHPRTLHRPADVACQVRDAVGRGGQLSLSLLGNRWGLIPSATLAAYRCSADLCRCLADLQADH